MTAFPIGNPDDLAKYIHFIGGMEFPYVVAATKERDRTKAQNRLLHKWFGEIAAHAGDVTPLEVKARCNLTYGRPIKMRDDEWSRVFGYLFDALDYERKLTAIRVLDVPFTRDMKVPELTEYMDQMRRDHEGQGIVLTEPERLAG